ncbi:MAG TPA: ribonuclease III [Acidimicrobiales bacterium]|nr:ribonuclease III [Acidimicrobiales bacterium]
MAARRDVPALTPAMLALAERIGWDVEDQTLLAQSMAHRSWCAEHPGEPSNERLEFLGDAVLGWVVTDHLYVNYPDLPEGELAKVRSSLVNSQALAAVATSIGLGESLLLGKGEDQSGGREKPSILSDATEAVIGALYLDRGPDAAVELIMRLLGQRIADAAAGPGGEDYKTRLQERCAREFEELPSYVVTDEGPDHAKHFHAAVIVRGERLGTGSGRSKKQAEQAAARAAWGRLARTGSDGSGGSAGAAQPGSDGSATRRP